ncbi:MAG: OmpA family protein [Flavobacteriaceae bacterium]|nr:OmpA family protein [Flavobacteriaceae bacterium]
MKKFFLLSGILFICITACQKETSTTKTTTQPVQDSEIQEATTSSEPESQTTHKSTIFDPNTLPTSTAELGKFPYYTTPEWLKAGGYSTDGELDFSKYEIFTGNSFHTVEGRVNILNFNMKEQDQKWNEYKFSKSFSDHFESLGAKKIWEGTSPWDAFEDLNQKNNNDQYSFKYSSAAIQENQQIYGLNHNGKEVYFIIASNMAYGSITVIESEDFVQTISIIPSEQIQKELIEKGKAVLHIHFDTNKASLKDDGKKAVAEITKVLQNNPSLKIEIQGHTDNSGSVAHNHQLSENRAKTVLNELILEGIDANRLESKDLGDTKPIATNDNEEGKAKNRRVELIKL